jgi:anti-sigma factor RsiW
MTARANRFLAAYLKGEGRPPRDRSVLAFTQVCSASARASARFRADDWDKLHPLTVTMRAGAQRISSRGGNRKTAAAIDPVASRGACATVKAERARGTALVRRRFRAPFTMLGLPMVHARVRAKGRGGFIAARLWDVHRGRQTLVSRGVYRLRDNQRGRIVFQLFGGGWRFLKGHTAKLELLGRDPNYLRTSNFRFSVRVARARVELPGQ